MAKVLKKKTTKAKTVKTVKFEGKMLTVKTGCKTYGSPVKELGKCKTCIKREGDTALACFIEGGFNKPSKIKPERKVAEYDFVKVWQNGMPRGGMKKCIIPLVTKGKFTRKQIVDKICKQFPDAKKNTASLYIGHGMRGKGKDAKRFDYKIVADKNGLLSFDKEQPKGSWGQV